MDKLFMAALEEARKHRAEYLAALTDAERTAFLTQLLAELNDPPPFPNLAEIGPGITLLPNAKLRIAPDEHSVQRKDAAALASSVRFLQGQSVNSGNWRSRCGCDPVSTCTTAQHGTSYMVVDYNYGVGRGAFDIVVYLRHYGRESFGGKDWDFFVKCPAAYRLWQSARLTGPGSAGRGGYFSSGNNQTPGPHTGTLGVAAYTPGTDTIAWWGQWYFDSQSSIQWEGWGTNGCTAGKTMPSGSETDDAKPTTPNQVLQQTAAATLVLESSLSLGAGEQRGGTKGSGVDRGTKGSGVGKTTCLSDSRPLSRPDPKANGATASRKECRGPAEPRPVVSRRDVVRCLSCMRRNGARAVLRGGGEGRANAPLKCFPCKSLHC